MIQTAQALWGMKPPPVKVQEAQPKPIIAPVFSNMPAAEAQTMRMKSALRASLLPLGCAGAECIVR
jgi:hypothetical protein